jgi:dihydrolipoamide dehydrogenase
MGIGIGKPKLDLAAMMKFKDEGVDGNVKGVSFLFKKNKIEWLKGRASFVDANTVQVGDRKVTAKNIVIATGSSVTPLPGITIDQERIVDSTGALELPEVPKRMVVIGGGVIGLELGSVWRRLGAEVTVVEFLDQILPGFDGEVRKEANKIFNKQGLTFRLSTKVTKAERKGDTVTLTVEPAAGGAAETIEADVVLVSIGRKPNTDGLGLEKAGLETNKRGQIETDHDFRTKVPGIWAIGDVIPSVVYTMPEIAGVGLTEEEAKEHGEVKVGKFPMLANSRAKTNREPDGFVKVIADAKTDRVLGVWMIASVAGTMIAEAALAMEFGATSEDIAYTCHAHPTHSEALKEAAMAVAGKPIHI